MECGYEQCDRPARSGGLCGAHYNQQWRGTELRPLVQPRRTCSIEDCDGAHQARTYCASHYSQWRRGEEPGQVRRLKRWGTGNPIDAYRWQRYRLSPQDFADLLAGQGGRCAGCQTEEPTGYGWCVDHDHGCCPGQTSCGACVRGLLCGSCNGALGLLRDQPNVLRRLAAYLDGDTQ